jgi:hypothetical protein
VGHFQDPAAERWRFRSKNADGKIGLESRCPIRARKCPKMPDFARRFPIDLRWEIRRKDQIIGQERKMGGSVHNWEHNSLTNGEMSRKIFGMF